MATLLLCFCVLFLCTPRLRRAIGRSCARLGHALAHWRQLKRPWRVAWASARRKDP